MCIGTWTTPWVADAGEPKSPHTWSFLLTESDTPCPPPPGGLRNPQGRILQRRVIGYEAIQKQVQRVLCAHHLEVGLVLERGGEGPAAEAEAVPTQVRDLERRVRREPRRHERHLGRPQPRAAEVLGADIDGARDEDAGEILASRIIEFMKRLNLPSGLAAVGYSKDDIPALVEGTLPQHRVTKISPRATEADDLARMFADALSYW